MIIGYTQGTFDLFHIGHLNLIRRAKEKCDYLIVGVNSDELVKHYKNKVPIIDEQDRLEIVHALKYVDECVLCNSLDKMEAWNKFKFNYIFIGDDWKNSTRWNETEKELEQVSAKVIYLPYTTKISSTEIREVLNNEDKYNNASL